MLPQRDTQHAKNIKYYPMTSLPQARCDEAIWQRELVMVEKRFLGGVFCKPKRTLKM